MKKTKETKVNDDGLVEVEIENIDPEVYRQLVVIAKKRNMTVDAVASQLVQEAFDNGFFEEKNLKKVAKEIKKETKPTKKAKRGQKSRR